MKNERREALLKARSKIRAKKIRANRPIVKTQIGKHFHKLISEEFNQLRAVFYDQAQTRKQESEQLVEILEKISNHTNLSNEVKRLEEAVSGIKIPDNKEVSIAGIKDLLKALKGNKPKDFPEFPKISFEGVVKELKQLKKAVQEQAVKDQDPSKYTPVRRVILLGKSFIYDDNITGTGGGGGGGGSSSSSGGAVTNDGSFATPAKQDTGNVSLASIDGKITAVNTGAVVVSSSALPSGAATAAKQLADGHNVVVTSAPTTAVTGTFWQATQPVSLASVPSHAVTNAGVFVTQDTLQTGDNTVGRVKLTDGTNVASVRDTGSSDSLNVAIVDASGDQITSFGGDTSLLSTAAKQDVIIGHVDGLEALIGTTNTNTAAATTALQIMDDWDETNRAAVNLVAGQVGVAAGAGTDSALTVRVTESTGATGTVTSVNDTASSTTLLSAAATRRKFIMYNSSTVDCYVKYGTTASATDFTWLVPAGATLEEEHYNGRVDGIWSSDASGAMKITEVT